MRNRYSSNCAGFVYIKELKSRAVCLCQCKILLGDAEPELVNCNKLGFLVSLPTLLDKLQQ